MRNTTQTNLKKITASVIYLLYSKTAFWTQPRETMTKSCDISQLRQGLRGECSVIAWKANVVRALRKSLCYFYPRSPPIHNFYILPENGIS